MKCEIDLKLPSLNEYINVCRNNAYSAAKFKKNIENSIMNFTNKLPKIKEPVIIHFHWIEANRRRDLDNVAFAKKFILDALVKSGKLPNDNQNWVKGFTDSFDYCEKAKVIIEFERVSQYYQRSVDEIPNICPYKLGYEDNKKCPAKSCEECWNRPLDEEIKK